MNHAIVRTLVIAAILIPTMTAQSPDASPAKKPVTAKLGEVAPDFELKDIDGKSVKLSDHKGKVIVLEWYNPDCPFVRRAHTEGTLKGLSSKITKDRNVVWLSINSSAPGKQGHGIELNKDRRKKYGITNPILVDEDGKVGRLYRAARTPEIFILDQKMKVAYHGAQDNGLELSRLPAGEKGEKVNHIDQVVTALLAGKKPPVTSTKPVG